MSHIKYKISRILKTHHFVYKCNAILDCFPGVSADDLI